jgi:membrane associated rhomboid family serine protease
MILARYTAMRFLLFVGFFALFMLFLDPLWAAVAGLLASMAASFFILRPDRERLAAGLEERVDRRIAKRREQIEAERTAED